MGLFQIWQKSHVLPNRQVLPFQSRSNNSKLQFVTSPLLLQYPLPQDHQQLNIWHHHPMVNRSPRTGTQAIPAHEPPEDDEPTPTKTCSHRGVPQWCSRSTTLLPPPCGILHHYNWFVAKQGHQLSLIVHLLMMTLSWRVAVCKKETSL